MPAAEHPVIVQMDRRVDEPARIDFTIGRDEVERDVVVVWIMENSVGGCPDRQRQRGLAGTPVLAASPPNVAGGGENIDARPAIGSQPGAHGRGKQVSTTVEDPLS